MERSLLLVILIAFPLAVFWILILMRLRRGQIYRADTLIRTELNKMHRHTGWTVLQCVLMLVVAAFVPTTRLYFGLPALIMLFGILSLRTIFVEMGVRYNRNGKPTNATRETHAQNDG